ncbi:DUF805 domain-containing protein [Sphingomonas sp. BK345]|uniref:DUF805 domain-containing protein n=1 Tax=Sphingomonas sp. BK345 TaxID=2586980 RepID=UPI00160A77DE|nr:DUF805 domain-containing protein [Sphingomonas sp. BK345]MBB3472363.1 uncharacterized membrane protein YhaH (DUF805 family) [Sphingomonas sp. BK345]
MEHLTRPWRLYGELAGRATRRELFGFDLTLLAALALAWHAPDLAAPWLGALDLRPEMARGGVLLAALGFVLLFGAAPGVAVHARRLHDADRSGWWLLVPVAAPLLLLPGTRGPNRHGADPRGSERAAPAPDSAPEPLRAAAAAAAT